MAKDFYSVLDIDPETETETEKEDIRLAYIHIARRYHPDLSKDPIAHSSPNQRTLLQ
ncbi:MAG TPA: DnaJ domain-containing protein [Methylococcales bacterium]